ncbi:MAG: UbiA family prenyltransferase [Candidatus Saccharimonas sp.]|nr:UbiA family prenyltransferase [Planctomycetaceae bacterium]
MLAYLQLIRLPTVFTAMADIVLGYVLTHRFIVGPQGWDDPAKFFGLLVSSCCLYLAGMVFNDVFDRKQDAAERPSRPIPSGRVSLVSAVVLGTVLMIVGVAAAATVTRVSLQVAGLLVVAILAYDAVLKRTPLAPLAMGLCRALNVMLGASDHEFWKPFFLGPPQTYAAAFLGLYIVGVTLFARTEARTSSRWILGLALLILDAAFGGLAWLTSSWPTGANVSVVLALFGVIAFTLNRRAIAAIIEPSPEKVQLTIKVMLLSYVMLDATLVFWKMAESGQLGSAHALATAALVIPAILLSRLIPMT